MRVFLLAVLTSLAAGSCGGTDPETSRRTDALDRRRMDQNSMDQNSMDQGRDHERPEQGRPDPSVPAPDAGSGTGRTGDAPTPDPRYEGPPVTARDVRDLHRESPGYEVEATVTVPTGGWELVFDGVDDTVTPRRLRFTLISPGEDELVTQALATLTALGSTTEPVDRVVVAVARRVRGHHYIVHPPWAPVTEVRFR